MRKYKVLVISRFHPLAFKAGGPPRSLQAIFKLLSKEIEFHIISSDEDLDKSKFTSSDIAKFEKDMKVSSTFLNKKQHPVRSIFSVVKSFEPDFIYFNSFFDAKFSVIPIFFLNLIGFSEKLILAPRGELSKGAISLKKNRKLFFIFICKFISLHQKLLWHASTRLEKEEIISLGFSKNPSVFVALNAIDFVPDKFELAKRKAKPAKTALKICFISRISPKKNLEYCIEVLNTVKVPCSFDIFGPSSDTIYLEKCKKLAQDSGSNVIINFKGELSRGDLVGTLTSYHLFFLPTLGENFGHAIVESLLCGTPVLISRNTPWNHLSDNDGCAALDLSNPGEFAKIIENFYLMNEKEFNIAVKSALISGTKVSSGNEIKVPLLELFS